MSFDVNRLYQLLPVFYRVRDARLGAKVLTADDKASIAQLTVELNGIINQDSLEANSLRNLLDEKQRGPLKALLSIIAGQIAVLEDNFDQLYDDQFIETCAEWVVPYIGDLVATRGLYVYPDADFSQRSQVANTLSYRRRKGTAAVLEQLARDVTGWNASVVEYFQLLATTQYLNHLRPENKSVTSVRAWDTHEKINKPFDKTTRTLDVRSIENKSGKYNIPNIGIWLWRINSYPHTKSPAYKVDNTRYKFNCLGLDLPLYNNPQTDSIITHLADDSNVAMPIGRNMLTGLDKYYGDQNKSILIYKNDKAVLPGEDGPPYLNDLINVCNLSDLLDPGGNIIGWANTPVDKITIDPVLGRLAFPLIDVPAKVEVDYFSGFSTALGGGEYGRGGTFDAELKNIIKVPFESPTIQNALNDLTLTGGIVEIHNNDYYFETPVVKIASGKKIELRAADGFNPLLVLDGDLIIEGGDNAVFSVNGLAFSGGSLKIPLNTTAAGDNKLHSLLIEHCTIVPGASPQIGPRASKAAVPALVVELPDSVINIEASVTGSILAVDGANISVNNSIIDAANATGTAYSGLLDSDQGASLTIKNTTIIGKIYTLVMNASNSILYAALKPIDAWATPVIAERLQEGCIRFSYAPFGSKLPRLYHCLPGNAELAASVKPVFTSQKYGNAAYCQLSEHCTRQIRQGADDEAEMGVFHNLYQPQREQNLRARLTEYLRFGLEAGILYAS
ncbi:hypothetical protein [Mucilaginibacter sp.]|uniref:hypothetical protein n=1 Tax=Mucilaginibacter sp. TaxID=1882438 RepID=UPI0026183048|nr:hypothetical protein [Mucilaginibacter sp.]MDB4923276.1 hypothetical protein [Mucilaginibacter sp.]